MRPVEVILVDAAAAPVRPHDADVGEVGAPLGGAVESVEIFRHPAKGEAADPSQHGPRCSKRELCEV